MSTSETFIHESSLVGPQVELGQGVYVGPYCHIDGPVVLSDGVHISSHAVVKGRTFVGARTKISSFATVGAKPQDLKYHGEDTELSIGEENDIREYANLSIGTEGGGGKTFIGNRNLIMMGVHLAHDVIMGNGNILANNVGVAGHCVIEDHVFIGGHSGLHQFVRVGRYAMIGGASAVVQDVPPFCRAQGDRARLRGLNSEGLRRAGLSERIQNAIKDMYRLVFRTNLVLDEALNAIETQIEESLEREAFVSFLRTSLRGTCR